MAFYTAYARRASIRFAARQASSGMPVSIALQGGVFRLGQNLPAGNDQRLALRIGADRNTQVLVDTRQLEVTHDDAALP